MRLLASLSILAWCISPVVPNVEKTVFLAPAAITRLDQQPGLDQPNLRVLTPSQWAIRTHLTASFPSPDHTLGAEAWLLLDQLSQHQRYEVRICWAATQPTSFTLNTYTLAEVLTTPSLIAALADFSESHTAATSGSEAITPLPGPRSILFLQIFAAANYYSTNKTLMQNVPPVKADIILDPFLLNILPRSLGRTAIYLIGLAITSWFLSFYVWQELQSISQTGTERDATRDDNAPSASAKKDS